MDHHGMGGSCGVLPAFGFKTQPSSTCTGIVLFGRTVVEDTPTVYSFRTMVRMRSCEGTANHNQHYEGHYISW